MKVGDLVRYTSPANLDYEGEALQGIIIKINDEDANGTLCTVLCHDDTVRYFFINEIAKV